MLRPLTGLTPEKFNGLAKAVSKRQKGRRGRKHALSVEERLFAALLYYRTYITLEFIGFQMEVDGTTIGRNIKSMEKMLAGIFRIPERRMDVNDGDCAAIIYDGTEQPIQRPKKKQKKWYSGKKKGHRVKHQVVVERTKKGPRVRAVSKSFPGRDHDKKMYDETRAYADGKVPGFGDTGYLGTALSIPKKSSKHHPLSKDEKEGNRRLSSFRISVEHCFAHMKIWKIAADRYRNPRGNHALMFKNVAGLHNLMFT